jgi:hypothetical protein
MSIVAVHGPYTFGSKAVQEAGPVQALPNAADGTIWAFRLDRPTTRVNADFVWTYTPAGGAPVSPVPTPGPTTSIDFTTAGAKTVTLTVTGAGTGANPYPSAGAYPISINAVTGAGPPGTSLRSLPPEEGEVAPEGEITEETPVVEDYDPGEHTVDEVKEYVTEHPEALETVYEAEYQGKSRTTLVTWLEEQFPYDPGVWTVQEVTDYAEANPGELEDIIAAEQAGKSRTTLLSHLEAMR